MGAERAEALEVLRNVWQSNDQSAADLDDCNESGACKKMKEAGVNFDEYGGATETDRIAGWRGRLEREGKLRSGSVRDLVFGPSVTANSGR